MIEALGLLLAVVGLLFAFERPRNWFVGLFYKKPALRHSFQSRTQFHAHNEGKALGPIGTNKTDKTHFLEWTVVNQTSEPIQIERGMVLKGAASSGRDVFLTPGRFTNELSILPKHKVVLLQTELTPAQVDHFRHWVRESTAFGLRTADGAEHLVPSEQLAAFRNALAVLAKVYGLAEEVPPGTSVVLSAKRVPEKPNT